MKLETEKMPKLGFGLMRLPKKGEEVDLDAVKKMVDTCMEGGMNYFDTAYVYHSGKSEGIAKEVLVSRYPRENFYLATKLPAWELKGPEDRDRIFREQLTRCGVEYFDFYLLHSVEDEENYEIYEKYDCFRWALEKKKAGQIRHFGFSFHGTPGLLEQILDKYPEVEFVQIQLNYMDWDNPKVQSGKLYEILHKRGIPIIVMEPVKGGNLASLPPEADGLLKAEHPDASSASWALRFAASLDGVMTVLSGMSTQEQMEDNLHTFGQFEPLTEKEKEVLQAVVKKMNEIPQVPCTACGYCLDGCPKSIRIPDIFRALNSRRLYPDSPGAKNQYDALIKEGSGKAGDCIECKQCEGVCPQHLSITEYLKEAAETL
ncbi:aldo/keto reductase [Candidatus Bariatricus faecipullorum]